MKIKAFFQIVVAGILWGTSGIFVKLLSPYGISSIQMTAIRSVVSFLCMVGYAMLFDRAHLRVSAKQVPFIVGAGAALFGTAWCYYTAMQQTSIATAVVLMYTSPIYIMLFSVMVLGERFSRQKLIAVICVMLGCCLVSGVVGGLKFHLIGILLGFLSGILYGAYNVLAKMTLMRGCHPVSATLYSFAVMAGIALFVANPQKIVTVLAVKPAITWPLAVGMGIVTFVLPHFLYTVAIREIPVGTASALSIIEPMAATVFGVLFFREKLDVFSGSGIVLILFAVLLLSRVDREEKAEECS